MANGFSSVLKAFRTRLSAASSSVVNIAGRNGDASVDIYGNLMVRDAVIVPSGGTAGDAWVYQAVPAVASASIRAPATILTQVGGFNDSGGNIYVQLHNRLALVPGDAPVMTFFVPMNSSFSWTPSNGGRFFSVGLYFGVSSTKDTYTALATNIFLFAQGIIV